MDDKLIAGKWEMSIGNTLIPASLLGDISPNYEEGTLEANTQAGTRKQPSGKADTAELTFTLFLPNFKILKTLWADAYNESKNKQKTSGNVVFGKGSVNTRRALPINIHQAGEPTDDNDIHIFKGITSMKFNPTLSTSDALEIEVTINMQPTEEGYFRVGTGDLTKPSRWDAASMTTVAISE